MLVMGMAGAGNGPNVSDDDDDDDSTDTNTDQNNSDQSGSRRGGTDVRIKESRLNDASVELYLSMRLIHLHIFESKFLLFFFFQLIAFGDI